MTDSIEIHCPTPFSRYERVTLAHGGGGRLMHRLIEEVFVREFASPELREGHDGARVEVSSPIAVTTDAFTVQPLFFPGGDIGSLAVIGTVNDLAVSGARARVLTASFVLEEGFSLSDLQRIVRSMAAAARRCGVRIVSGDTKVVERGKGDGVFITTSGVGEVFADISPRRVQCGDAVIVSGPVGEHGTAVLFARERLELPEGLISDCADISPAVIALCDAHVDVHCLRDATRGGVATVVAEIADRARLGIELDDLIPVREQVADACELLGLDPLYVACEGRFVAFVPEAQAARAVDVMRTTKVGVEAVRIGTVTGAGDGVVTLRTALGGTRILDIPSGEQLPRIC